MPSLCDSYSPTLQSPSFFVQRSDLLYVSNRESGCVCVFFLSFSLPPCLLSPLSMCIVLWCQPAISDPFLRFTANFTPSSLHHFNPSIIPLLILPQFEAELLTFHSKIQMKLSHYGNLMLFWQLSSGFLPLSCFFLHNSSNYFFNTSALAFLCCLFLSPSFSSPSPVLLARSPDRCGSLCGTNRPEAEGCLCPFRLITSHLCVHKQTNTAINLRAQYRLRGWGRGRGREAKRW